MAKLYCGPWGHSADVVIQLLPPPGDGGLGNQPALMLLCMYVFRLKTEYWQYVYLKIYIYIYILYMYNDLKMKSELDMSRAFSMSR